MKQLHTYTACRIALLLATVGFLQLVAVVPTARAQQTSRLVFAVPVFTVIEGMNERATLTVNRIGDASGAASVTYATSDISTSLARCDTVSGIASERCDYSTSIDTLRFAPGETSKKLHCPDHQRHV